MESKQEIILSIEERRENGTLSGEELKRELCRLGLTALEEGDFVTALRAYIEVGDNNKVREIGEVCFRNEWYVDSNKAFRFLRDRDGVYRIIKKIERNSCGLIINHAMSNHPAMA